MFAATADAWRRRRVTGRGMGAEATQCRAQEKNSEHFFTKFDSTLTG